MVNILFLIDDDEDDREIFQEAVTNCNPDIEILFAKDGVEALEMLRLGRTHPDVIFLDYNMPKMNGIECLKRLKEDEHTKDIPTIMYTTSGDPQHEKNVLGLGADYYMKKTFTFESLCEELKRLLELIATNVDLKTVRRLRP